MDWKQKLALAYSTERPQQKFLNKNPNQSKSLADAVYKPQRTSGKHALKQYVGVVEYPISRGGGTVWIKSIVALRKYQDLNYKVVWL